jgi:hypothetical protein
MPPGGRWQASFEGDFLQSYFAALKLLLGEDFHRWTFHLLHHNLAVRPLELPLLGKGHVLMWFSDESSGPADDAASKFEYVFKSYALTSARPRNVHHFPLFGASAVLHKNLVEFDRRDYQVFFSGNLNRQRAELFFRLKFPILDALPSFTLGRVGARTLALLGKCLRKTSPTVHSFSSSFIQFNGGFATGLTRHEYADVLARSKICLCPSGFITRETMRHFEAMKLGCVVISESLPSSPYYTASPIVQIAKWRGIRKVLGALLSNPDRMREISFATQAWWRKVCSPASAAQATAQVLKHSK